MRILVVQESDWLKRGPHQQHHLFERLIEQGHEVRVIDYEIDWKKAAHRDLISQTKVYRVPSKSVANQHVIVIRPPMIKAPILCYASILIFHSIAIARQMKSFRPDVVVGMGILNSYLAARIGKSFGIPFVYYLIDSLHALIPERLFRPFGYLIEKRNAKLASKVLAINKHLGRYAEKLGAPKTPEILTAGIDKTRFNPDIDGKPIRSALEIPQNAKVVFFMGWLYNFSGLREVAKSVSREISDVYLLVLGRGDLHAELTELAVKSNRNAIKIVSWVPYENVPEYLAAADICILPAYLNDVMRDTVPIKLYEYLACGKPVIATKLPGVVQEFKNACGVVYVDNPEDVIEQAKLICSDRKQYRELCDKALFCTRLLEWRDISIRFLHILQNTVGMKSMTKENKDS